MPVLGHTDPIGVLWAATPGVACSGTSLHRTTPPGQPSNKDPGGAPPLADERLMMTRKATSLSSCRLSPSGDRVCLVDALRSLRGCNEAQARDLVRRLLRDGRLSAQTLQKSTVKPAGAQQARPITFIDIDDDLEQLIATLPCRSLAELDSKLARQDSHCAPKGEEGLDPMRLDVVV